jgi:hypothetical protein
VVNQTERSKSRKRLTFLCGEVIKATASRRVMDDDQTSLKTLHNTLSFGVLQIITEEYLGIKLDKKMIDREPCLSMFKGSDNNTEAEATLRLREFINRNREQISPEDLGGICELLSGHQLSIVEDEIIFSNNIERRNAGRIYTPFDVTNHICQNTLSPLVQALTVKEELFKLRILDPAVGSGAFLVQAFRVLVNLASERGWVLDASEKQRLIEEVLHGIDIDEFAANTSMLVLWIEAKGDAVKLAPSISVGDTLVLGPQPIHSKWEKMFGITMNRSGYDAVIGNPPYVQVKPDDYPEFTLSNARNLYALFVELGLSITNKSGIFSMIVPQSLMVSKNGSEVRKHLLKLDGRIEFQVFDSVPDFLFDQGKIEKNTNTNINQRTVIVTVDLGRPKGVNTSSLLRWRRGERNELFNNLKLVEIDLSDVTNDRIPMLYDSKGLNLLKSLRSITSKIEDYDSDDGIDLYLTKAVRYFITALPTSLGRKNSMKISVPADIFPVIHVLLNSNVFYWWWRVFGNGFQIDSGDVGLFPLIPIPLEVAKELSLELISAESQCTVNKRNAGQDIPNVNYNFRQDILQKIDKTIFKALGLQFNGRVFHSKSNSLYQKMDKLVGYGGQK